jgi:hypothetical protein
MTIVMQVIAGFIEALSALNIQFIIRDVGFPTD